VKSQYLEFAHAQLSLQLTVRIPNVLINLPRRRARIHLLHALRLHRFAVHKVLFVHDLLQRSILPAEQVIAVIRVPSLITKRVNERLATVFGPERGVIEVFGLVNDFEHELRHAYGM
jgi:hypothetical protein